MFIRMGAHVCEGTCVSVYMYVSIYVCYVCACSHVWAHTCVYVSVGVVCRCVYTCIWMYMYIGLKLSIGIFLGHSSPCSESLPKPRAH